jgi:hypothetical protein
MKNVYHGTWGARVRSRQPKNPRFAKSTKYRIARWSVGIVMQGVDGDEDLQVHQPGNPSLLKND